MNIQKLVFWLGAGCFPSSRVVGENTPEKIDSTSEAWYKLFYLVDLA